MRPEWRVACVRIPRFPVGALVEARAAGAAGAAAACPLGGPWPDAEGQLELLPPEPRAAGAAGATPNDGAAAPHWDDRPLALAEPGDARERLRAVTAAAGRAGVRAGMTATEARARCAALEVLPWDAAAVERAVTQTTAALLVASPQVTPVAGAPGMWWVGAGGLAHVGGERALVRALVRIAGAWHPRARVAVADSCVAARAATGADA
ncbi:MAG: hypothetical protein ACJ8AO_02560, partial [Gemmatimonadaceae bacterium]